MYIIKYSDIVTTTDARHLFLYYISWNKITYSMFIVYNGTSFKNRIS